MRYHIWILGVVLCLTATPGPMAALGAGSTPDDRAIKALYDPNTGIADAQGAALDDGSGVVVAVDDKTETATIQFVKPWHKGKLSFTVAAAVDKETGDAVFVGFDQPLGAQQAKLEYNYIRWPRFSLFERYKDAPPGTYEGKDLLDSQLLHEISVCSDAISTLKERLKKGLRQTLWSVELESLYKDVEEATPPTRQEIEAYLKRTEGRPNLPATEEEKKAEARVQSLIQSLDQGKGACFQLKSLMPRLYWVEAVTRGELTSRRAAMILGVNGTVGRKEFTFLDRDLLQSEGEVDTISRDESPTSVGFRLGWIFLTRELEGAPEFSLIFSYNRERGFKAADDLTFCQPAEGLEGFPSLESCKEIPGAAPSSSDSDLLSAEYRRKFKKIGLTIRGFYRGNDDKADDFGLEVPVYFLANKDGAFQGGVTFGWRDQDDHGFIAVFVGRKFELF